MANKKRGRPPKQNNNKIKKQKEQISFYRKHHNIIVQIFAVLSIFIGIFGLISMFSELTGTLGHSFKLLSLGLFGTVGYLFPLALIYIGVNTALKADKGGYIRGNTSSIGLLIFVGALVHLFVVNDNPTKSIVKLWKFANDGKNLWSGGVLGGFLTSLLVNPLGKIGIIIIYSAILVILSILLSDTTVAKILHYFSSFFHRENNPDRKRAHIDTAEDLEDYDREFSPTYRQKSKIDLDIEPKTIPQNPDLDAIFTKDKLNSPSASAPIFKQQTTHNEVDEPVLPPVVSPAQPATITKQEISEETKKVAAEINENEGTKQYNFPPVSLLAKDKQYSIRGSNEIQVTAEKIVATLKSFGVDTHLTDVAQGPTVTRYELAPSAGVKISKITNLSDDIALSLAASGVRIEAPIPGKAAVGIEVPNKTLNTVYLRTIIESEAFKKSDSKLTFCLGCDLGGEKIVADIAKMPHMLIAGSTGSGKSVCINSLIISLLYKSTPDEVRLILIDPKVVELGGYNGIPHLLLPVVTDPKKASGTLSWAVGEMTKRYKLFADYNVKNISGYNKLCETREDIEKIPQIVIIIDELAELMMVSPREVEDSINRIAALARAAGMHLVVATQRPSVDVITGVIKANIPTRIAFSVTSQIDSRTILDMGGAEKLIGRGDMLFAPIGEQKPIRIQGCYVSEKEIETVIEFVKNQAETKYDDKVIEEIEKQVAESGKKKGAASDSENEGDGDPVLAQAIEVVVEAGSASTSLLQRKLKLGYARAARIIDEMEEKGIVGPYQGSKPREVLISKQQLYEYQMRIADNSELSSSPHEDISE